MGCNSCNDSKIQSRCQYERLVGGLSQNKKVKTAAARETHVTAAVKGALLKSDSGAGLRNSPKSTRCFFASNLKGVVVPVSISQPAVTIYGRYAKSISLALASSVKNFLVPADCTRTHLICSPKIFHFSVHCSLSSAVRVASQS